MNCGFRRQDTDLRTQAEKCKGSIALRMHVNIWMNLKVNDMNADIQCMLNYYKHKQMNILQSDSGQKIPSKDAKKYLKWCIKNGYKDLYSAPDWDEYVKQLNK